MLTTTPKVIFYISKEDEIEVLLETCQIIVMVSRKSEIQNEWSLNVVAKLIINELMLDILHDKTKSQFPQIKQINEFMSHVHEKITDYVELEISKGDWINILSKISTMHPIVKEIVSTVRKYLLENKI